MASSIYYPEMGEKPDAKAIFRTYHVINRTMALNWNLGNDAAARAAFKANRVKPRGIERCQLRDGSEKWSASCTWDAHQKLYDAGLVSRETLLD